MCLLHLPSILIWRNTKTCQICLLEYTIELLHFPPQIIVDLHVLNQSGVLLYNLLTSCFSHDDVRGACARTGNSSDKQDFVLSELCGCHVQ